MPEQKIPARAISAIRFPFKLTKDQEAVDQWVSNGYKGSIIYSTGTGKTEIAFECAKRAAKGPELAEDTPLSSNNLREKSNSTRSQFNILFLVPRIVLVEQNINRLVKYGLRKECIGAYFGEKKELREVAISTYKSAVNNTDLIHNSDMIVFDEVHLVSDTATSLSTIFDTIKEANNPKLLLGLTATIDEEEDPRYETIYPLCRQ